MNQSDNSRVQLCSDGKYRWVYEMNLLTNPTVFLTAFKSFSSSLFLYGSSSASLRISSTEMCKRSLILEK